MQYLPLIACGISLAALLLSILASKTDRARLEGTFSATVDAKIGILTTRFDSLERGVNAMSGTLASAMQKLETQGHDLAVLMDRGKRGHQVARDGR